MKDFYNIRGQNGGLSKFTDSFALTKCNFEEPWRTNL